MEIVKVIPSGFCKGVINAISIVKKTLQMYPDKKIYILGMLVHNSYVVDAFSAKGIITLNGASKHEMIDSITEGVVVFTAHGTDPKEMEYARKKGLIVVDATCSDVISNAKLCTQYLEKGYHILYIGKKNHPESEAVCALSERIHLVENRNLLSLPHIDSDRILITNQTTMSHLDILQTVEQLKKIYPHALIMQEICKATYRRQAAIMALKDFDALIVVGDPTSNNTQQLANIATQNSRMDVYKVEKAAQLVGIDFSHYRKIAVTSGASTPQYLTECVIAYLKTQDESLLNIDLNAILD